MALTISRMDQTVMGNKRVNRFRAALDTSYQSGGYPITAQQLGLGVIENLIFQAPSGYQIDYDDTSKTVRVYGISFTIVGGQSIGTPIQVSGSVLGKTPAVNVVTAGTPVEVAAATDLSAVTNVMGRAEGV